MLQDSVLAQIAKHGILLIAHKVLRLGHSDIDFSLVNGKEQHTTTVTTNIVISRNVPNEKVLVFFYFNSVSSYIYTELQLTTK